MSFQPFNQSYTNISFFLIFIGGIPPIINARFLFIDLYLFFIGLSLFDNRIILLHLFDFPFPPFLFHSCFFYLFSSFIFFHFTLSLTLPILLLNHFLRPPPPFFNPRIWRLAFPHDSIKLSPAENTDAPKYGHCLLNWMNTMSNAFTHISYSTSPVSTHCHLAGWEAL